MKITIDLTKEDYWKLNKFVMFHMPKYRNMLLLTIISLPIVIIALFRFVLDYSWLFSVITGILVSALSMFYMMFSIKRKVMRLVKTNDGIVGEHVIELNAEGLHESTVYNQAHYSWKGIEDVKSDKDYIYIFVNSIQGINIPRRAFADQEQEQAFVKQLEQYTHKKVS
ncbi:YcxB family protein [Paenibacillus sp. Marseille-Q4541]|uniref:YcxB family protein n=1 Tax=Paenibacillus sp. Marseille-Q4541 TaxID=2831522 RepID=UPI001BAD00AB|nr:YcxB family protein [Paenibacillus sp. Marseille-Q4541]